MLFYFLVPLGGMLIIFGITEYVRRTVYAQRAICPCGFYTAKITWWHQGLRSLPTYNVCPKCGREDTAAVIFSTILAGPALRKKAKVASHQSENYYKFLTSGSE